MKSSQCSNGGVALISTAINNDHVSQK